jgi:hypothetical protein
MDGVASISVQTTIAAPPERVWAEIADIGEENLDFPARMGGGVGGALAAPLLRWVWRRNLANLKSLVERPSAV